jgi:large subunit ribosomal protein L3
MPAGFAKKVGMTRVFKDGRSVPVTVIEVFPSYVLQVKNLKSDGYNAIQIGAFKTKKVTKPIHGHVTKKHQDFNSGFGSISEFKDLDLDSSKLVIDIRDFDKDQILSVSGIVKGRGFAGVVKRHGFAGQPASHGHDHNRAPGSIGSRWPQRVDKGKKMAGHMGSNNITLNKMKILDIDIDKNLLFIKGSIPGANGGILKIRKVSV